MASTSQQNPQEVTQQEQRADDLLCTKEAADVLKISKVTMEIWRCTRRQNIPYIKIGRAVRYRRGDLENWINARRVTPCPAIADGGAA
jgi:excisionase family DNA binding protein